MLSIPRLHGSPRNVLLRVSRGSSGGLFTFLVLTGTQKSSLVSSFCRISEIVARSSHGVPLLDETATIVRHLLVDCAGEIHRDNSLAFDQNVISWGIN